MGTRGLAEYLRLGGYSEERVNFQGVVMNVLDISRSIDFYREVLDFSLLSQKDQLAAVRAPGSDPPQVIVLRTLGRGPLDGGGHIGLRVFLLEVESAEQFERIGSELDSRGLLVSRRDHSDWAALVGHDPDGVTLVVSVAGEGQISQEKWRTLDDLLYGIGE